MAAFTIHGFEVKLSAIKERYELVGADVRRALDGSRRSSRRARKRAWDCTMQLSDPSVVSPVLELVHGEGHVWSFDTNIFSSKGMIPTGSAPTLDTTNKKFGASSASIPSAGTTTFPYTDETERTILLWRRPGSGSFDHYALVCSGASVTSKYKNGAPTVETVTNWFTPASDGSFSLLGKDNSGVNAAVNADDLVVLPFAATADMVTAWAAQTRAWAGLPFLNVSGDLFGAGVNYEVDPEPGDKSFVDGVSPADGTYKTLENLSFKITEV